MSMMPRYTVIPYRVWLRNDGRRASIYGSLPWASDADKANWSLATEGYTVRDNKRNTTGLGKPPYATQAEAEAAARALNKALAEGR